MANTTRFIQFSSVGWLDKAIILAPTTQNGKPLAAHNPS
jgi:hypothetical protein